MKKTTKIKSKPEPEPPVKESTEKETKIDEIKKVEPVSKGGRPSKWYTGKTKKELAGMVDAQRPDTEEFFPKQSITDIRQAIFAGLEALTTLKYTKVTPEQTDTFDNSSYIVAKRYLAERADEKTLIWVGLGIGFGMITIAAWGIKRQEKETKKPLPKTEPELQKHEFKIADEALDETELTPVATENESLPIS